MCHYALRVMGLGSRSCSLVRTNNPRAGGKDQPLWVPPPPFLTQFLVLSCPCASGRSRRKTAQPQGALSDGGTAPAQRELPVEGQLVR